MNPCDTGAHDAHEQDADEHGEVGEWAGAYTLGVLDPADRRRFEAHLRSCATCQSAVRDLAVLPGLLAGIDVAALDDTVDLATGAAIERRARDELSVLRRSRARWRWVAAAAAVVATSGAAWTVVRELDDGTPVSTPATTATAPTMATVSRSLADATAIGADARTWGTALTAEFSGLPERERYQLWTVDHGGAWTIAATWGPTPTGNTRLTGASSTPADRVARIVVTGDDRDDVIVDATLG